MATFTLLTKSETSFDLETKLSYLLQEIGAYLLLEDGGKIVLKGTAHFTNVTRTTSGYLSSPTIFPYTLQSPALVDGTGLIFNLISKN